MSKDKVKTRTISVDYLARVEGEGALYFKTQGNQVKDLKFKIFEPPRFFEAFLRGRDFTEAPDITSRICGICPVAYQMSAVNAIENALGIKVDESIRQLRRLLYCGEWIESHSLHIYMLHAPDFLGFEDAVAMNKKNRGVLEQGLALKKVGNLIGQILGGREVHPINIRVGGFYKLPEKAKLTALKEELKKARDLAIKTVNWVKDFDFLEFERDYLFVSLRHATDYPLNDGRLVSSQGLDIEIKDYEKYFTEVQVEHSNAHHSLFKNEHKYFVGPLARINNNYDRLSTMTKQVAQSAGIKGSMRNPFKSIIARALEVLYACDESIRILENYKGGEYPAEKVHAHSGIGYGCTEAPRGILYHRYNLAEDGKILQSKIVPPTSQNQGMIEEDLRNLIPQNLHLQDEKLKWKCEQAIRNYDPCISCATHFLKFEHVREY